MKQADLDLEPHSDPMFQAYQACTAIVSRMSYDEALQTPPIKRLLELAVIARERRKQQPKGKRHGKRRSNSKHRPA